MKNEDLCLERDANRCRTCGATKNLNAVKLINRDGAVSNHLSNLVTLCEDCRKERDYIRKNDINNRVGVLLCGGKGSRLMPLTRTLNKHELPIGICPMVFYPIKTLRTMGISRVLIVVDQFAASIMETVGSGKMFGMDFSFKVQDGAFGIADALYLAKDFVNEETKEIVVMLGDNIFDNDDLDVSRLTEQTVDNYWTNDDARVYLKRVKNPEDYGVAVVDKNQRVEKIVEKPKKFISDQAVLGLYIYRPNVFDVIEKIKPSNRGELEISAVNHYFAERGSLESREVNGYWADCGGSVKRYCEASLHGAKQANVSEEEINGFVSLVFDDK